MNPFNKLRPRRITLSQTEGHYLEPSQLWLQNSYALATDRHTAKSAVGSHQVKDATVGQRAADAGLPGSGGSMYNLGQRLLPIRATSTVMQDSSLTLCLQSKRLDKDAESTDQLQIRDMVVAEPMPACLPGDRVIFGESPNMPGLPIVYRTPSERAINPDRLNLDRRRLTVLPLLQDESDLRLLNCQHNSIRLIENLHAITKLIFLDLFDNQIGAISGLACLVSLRVLMLGKNKIKKIEGVDQLARLDVLDLHGNEIEHIENLNHLSELRILNLASNRITFVGNLEGLDSLMELNLQHNSIRMVCDVDMLPRLHRLLLGFNEIISFDDVISIAGCASLQEVSFRGNPLASSPAYKQVVLKSMQHLRQLDLKILTEEEKRIAMVIGRKEDDRRRELNKFAVIKEKQREVKNSRRRLLDGTRDDLHLAGAPAEGSDKCAADLSESDCDRATRERDSQPPKHRHQLKKHLPVKCLEGITTDVPKKSSESSVVPVASTLKRSPAEISMSKDTLTWVESSQSIMDRLRCSQNVGKEALTFSGPASLDSLDRSGSAQPMPAISTSAVVFKFVNFTDIATRALPRLLTLTNLETLVLIGTGISSLRQLNALAQLRRLEHLTLSNLGNGITELDLWQHYLLFRLANCPLKTINGVQVTNADVTCAEQMFHGLEKCLTKFLADSGNHIGGQRRLRRVPKKTGEATAAGFQARALLGYSAPEDARSVQARSKLAVATAEIARVTRDALAASITRLTIEEHWPTIFANVVNHIASSMVDSDAHTRPCIESLVSGNAGYHDITLSTTKAAA